MTSIKEAFKNYEKVTEFSGIRISGKILIVLTIISSIAASVLLYPIDIVISILGALVILDLGIGMPYFLSNRKVDRIESALPDVLHHMSTTLKTGGTIETALKEASRMDYGPITTSLRKMLREIEEGSTFERSLQKFAERSRSTLLKKASMIIIAARSSGGGLIDTLTAMSDDIRSLRRLQSERRTKTLLQFLFIIVAGCFVAPMVFGIVRSVLAILVSVGGSSVQGGELIAKYDLIFKAYLVMESALSTIGAVQVREGSYSKAVIYLPILMLITYLIYVVVSSQFLGIIGGVSTTGIPALLFL